jgi:hypothetical protein
MSEVGAGTMGMRSPGPDRNGAPGFAENEPAGRWTPDRIALRQRIEAHPFQAAQTLSFTRRLARDHGWSMGFATGAVREYGRFCFLAVVSATPVTPSEEVDEVWHMHLTYSRDYWDVWCGQVLGVRLHHDPTQGGPAEQTRFVLHYARTLAEYETFFGPPPEVYWPGTRQRFQRRPRYQVLDTAKWLAVRRPSLRWGRR